MAFLLEQPHWPSHFNADKLGMKIYLPQRAGASSCRTARNNE
jgi:hypothetical protein